MSSLPASSAVPASPASSAPALPTASALTAEQGQAQLVEERRFRSLLALVAPEDRGEALEALQAIARHWPWLAVSYRVQAEPAQPPRDCDCTGNGH